MRNFYLFTILLFASVFIQAQQTGELKGRVLDDLKLPLAGADVSIVGENIFTSTENNGFYDLNRIPAGNYEVEFNYFGYLTQTISIEIKGGEVQTLDIVMQKGVELNKIEVVGSLTGTAKALNQQRNMINVGNIISAEQVEQFPDDNLGDALKRIPGINVQYDQGEARFGNIRGTSPDLSSVTLDGNRLPSAEGETRAVQLDLIPADMVQAVEVNKVVLPNMDGDAIGSSVNLVTRSVPSGRRIRTDLSGGYNTIAEKINYKGSVLYAERLFGNRLGVTLNGSVFNNFIESDNMEMDWKEKGGKNNGIHTEDFQLRKYEVQRLRQNYSLDLDYKFNRNHRVEAKYMYNQRDDWENRYRLRYRKIKWDEDKGAYVGELRKQTKGGKEKHSRLEKQKLSNLRFKGKHDFNFMDLKWSYSFAKASEIRPHERYIGYRKKKVALTSDYSNFRDVKLSPANAEDGKITNLDFRNLIEELRNTEEEDQTFGLDLKFPLMQGKFENTVRVGGKLRFKKKFRANVYTEYEPNDEDAFNSSAFKRLVDYSDPNFQASDLPMGHFINREFLSGLNLNNTALFKNKGLDLEEMAGNYNASENVNAAYIRFDQKIGKEWKFVTGLRLEQTKVTYNGFITDLKADSLTATGDRTQNFTNYMPSLLVKYSPARLWNVKFGLTKTIARPRYFDLVPYQIIDTKDMEISVGNPGLSPTKSLNLDLMTERYFKNIGLFEAGIFFKDIEDFIVKEYYRDYSFNGEVWKEFERPINGGDATLMGVEIGFQRPLDFITPALKAFSIYTNYTYTHSKVSNFNIENREKDKLSMPGSPEHTLNASLAYNTEKVEARVSYNYASEFIDEFGESDFYDRYYDAVNYLDFNINYNFSKKISTYVKINNILNQPLRYFQGEKERTMQVEFYGAKYKLGVQINF